MFCTKEKNASPREICPRNEMKFSRQTHVGSNMRAKMVVNKTSAICLMIID